MAPWISVRSDVEARVKDFDDLEKRQVPFATALALTMTVQDGQTAVRDSLPRRFTLRNNRVRSGIRITPASKSTLRAVVGSIDDFMAGQETGGTKTARDHSRVAVPVEAKRNKRDLIPKGQKPAALRGKPRILAWKGSNILSRKGGFGILQRVGRQRYPLRVLYWLKKGVKLRPILGFRGTVVEIVARRFGVNFERAMERARQTAK